MKTYNWTLSQLIGLGLLVLFAFVGWCGMSYLYGHIKGSDNTYDFIMKNGAYIKSNATEGK